MGADLGDLRARRHGRPARGSAEERLLEGSPMKPFIDLAGKAIQLLTTALGRLLLGKEESKPQTRRPGISNLRGLPLSVCEALVTGDEVGGLRDRGDWV
jgi:hypothetical protein